MNAVIRVTLPVCYFHFRLFLSWIGRGGGSDVFVWVFLKGHALIPSKKWEGQDFFLKKILKYPGPPSPIKSVPSLIVERNNLQKVFTKTRAKDVDFSKT